MPSLDEYLEAWSRTEEEEGRRWWVERDTPWTADSMAQLRELRHHQRLHLRAHETGQGRSPAAAHDPGLEVATGPARAEGLGGA